MFERYPSIKEALQHKMLFKKEVVAVLKEFKKQRPFKGSLFERQQRFFWLNKRLNEIYGQQIKLVFKKRSIFSPLGCYYPRIKTIVLFRLSVVTFLHEYSHSFYGNKEDKAVFYSVNLFKKVFPIAFKNSKKIGHCLFAKR
jgi:hypothetical protein